MRVALSQLPTTLPEPLTPVPSESTPFVGEPLSEGSIPLPPSGSEEIVPGSNVYPPDAETVYEPGQSQWIEPGSSPSGGCDKDFSHCAADGGGYCCPSNWYFYEGVRIFARSRPRGVSLGSDLFSATNTLTTRSLTFDATAGFQATIGRYLGRDSDNRDHFVELAYWGMNNWHESRQKNSLGQSSLVSNFYLKFGLQLPGFDFADQHLMTYSSDVDNFELSAWIRPRNRPDRLVLYPNGKWRRERQPGPTLSYLFGMRVMSLDEQFGFFGNATAYNNDAYVPTRGDYTIFTNNDMFGLQIGADLMFYGRRWEWGAVAKAAPMVNFTDQRTRLTTNGGVEGGFGGNLDVSRVVAKTCLSLAGQIGVTGKYRITPNFMVRASYDWMWYTGVALAPEQVTFTLNPPPRLNDNGHVFDHGLTLAIEWNW